MLDAIEEAELCRRCGADHMRVTEGKSVWYGIDQILTMNADFHERKLRDG